MRCDHIVEGDHIAFAPLEPDCILLVDFANVVHDRIFNWRTVAVVNVPGQIFALAVMAVAASEVVVGLGLIVAIARKRLDLDVDKLSVLRG